MSVCTLINDFMNQFLEIARVYPWFKQPKWSHNRICKSVSQRLSNFWSPCSPKHLYYNPLPNMINCLFCLSFIYSWVTQWYHKCSFWECCWYLYRSKSFFHNSIFLSLLIEHVIRNLFQNNLAKYGGDVNPYFYYFSGTSENKIYARILICFYRLQIAKHLRIIWRKWRVLISWILTRYGNNLFTKS